MSDEPTRPTNTPPRWQPLPATERRILGVMVEKAKTTPDAYPMSLNALRTGCNQKNNRDPLMDLELEDVEDALERLRPLGAVAVIQGSGRVSKYRHYMYEWLGVDKFELAVMTELLLRGAQTEGELRGRASRMEPIADLSALRPVLESLTAKGLIVSLTPEGRGHMLTHALYLPQELERVRSKSLALSAAQAASGGDPEERIAARTVSSPPSRSHESPAPAAAASFDALSGLRRELDQALTEIRELKTELEEVRQQCQQNERELQRLQQALGG